VLVLTNLDVHFHSISSPQELPLTPSQSFEIALTAKLGSVSLNDNQCGALISWAYHISPAAMASSALARRTLAGEDVNTVAQEELPRSNKATVNGVLITSPTQVKRRQKELDFF
jgi:GH24 family phage-related lysozyme (muramidase)